MHGPSRALLWLLGIGLLTGSVQTTAAGFFVRWVDTQLVNDVYMLDAHLELELGSAPLEALNSGVPINIVVEIRILRERPYWLAERIAALTQRYRLEYHALSERYVLTNVNAGVSQTFDYLDDALAALGIIENYPLLDRELLKTGEQYTGTLRARLDIEKLPAPLRPLAYLSSRWRLSSDQYVWPLQR